jgi:hypothetical protein
MKERVGLVRVKAAAGGLKGFKNKPSAEPTRDRA